METWNKQQGGGATAVEEAPVTIDNVHDDRIRLIGHPLGGGSLPQHGEVEPPAIPAVPYPLNYPSVTISTPPRPEGVPPAPEAPQSNAKFAGGAVRSKDADGVRYDLVSPIGLRRLAETYAEGAAKYGAGNWLKGFPASTTINHLQRHIELWKSGDRTEDHLAHAAWGLFALMHFEEARPDLMDVSFETSSGVAGVLA